MSRNWSEGIEAAGPVPIPVFEGTLGWSQSWDGDDAVFPPPFISRCDELDQEDDGSPMRKVRHDGRTKGVDGFGCGATGLVDILFT